MVEDNHDGHLYKCEVYNAFLEITVGGSYLRVIVNPVVSAVPFGTPVLQYPRNELDNNFIAILDDTFELQCIFSGMPAPEIYWSRNNWVLPRDRYEDQGSRLRIFNVEWEDEGEYMCMGINFQGYANFTFNVDVQSKPEFMPEYQIDPAKRFESKNVTEGETVEFTCDAHLGTDPMPEVIIMINSEPISEVGQRMEIFEVADWSVGKILQLYNVCINCPEGGTDHMTIQCKISNVHGEIMKNIYLNVIPAEPPIITSTTHSMTQFPPTPTPNSGQHRMPAFSVYLSEDHIIGDSALVFDSVITNIGIGYSEITGHFTAPEHGLYFLVSIVSSAYGSGFQFHIMKNGVIQLCQASSAVDSQLGGTCVSVVELARGDSVVVSGITGSMSDNVCKGQQSSFSGYLIERYN